MLVGTYKADDHAGKNRDDASPRAERCTDVDRERGVCEGPDTTSERRREGHQEVGAEGDRNGGTRREAKSAEHAVRTVHVYRPEIELDHSHKGRSCAPTTSRECVGHPVETVCGHKVRFRLDKTTRRPTNVKSLILQVLCSFGTGSKSVGRGHKSYDVLVLTWDISYLGSTSGCPCCMILVWV